MAPFDIVSVTSALVFLTALSGGLLVRQEKAIDALIGIVMPQRIKDSGKRISLYLNGVLSEFEPRGSVYNTFAKEGRKMVISMVFAALIAVSAVLAYSIMQTLFPDYTNYVVAFAAILALVPLAHIFYSMKRLLDSAARAFHKAMGENLTLDDLAMRDSAIALLMFAVAFIIPLAVALLSLPMVFSAFFFVPLFLSVLFVWNLAMTVRKIMTRRERYHYERKRAAFKPPYRGMLGEIRSVNPPVYKGHANEKG